MDKKKKKSVFEVISELVDEDFKKLGLDEDELPILPVKEGDKDETDIHTSDR